MRIPYKWLKDYVSVDLAPEPLAERLTLAGLEVDRVEYPWPGVIVGQIIWQERVKGSDHLWATRVTTGREELSVVCGAPNIQPLDKVPLALVGAKVGDITIAEKKAMGVLSQGMLCSPRELGISDDHEGIYILPKDAMIGEPLGKLLGDAVIDLDIKAHRGDLFCVVGVAREVAAFTGRELRPPKIDVKEKGTSAARLMKLEVRDPDLCPRYTARVVRNVTLGPSPDWMAERLTQAGMRPINNVVDITNYVMLELGQPLHAFDYDKVAKVADHTIIVRRAHPGEELTTLDGVTRRLTPDMLLITDPAGPNVIAGIFGGERVEVGEGTTNVLLEAAHFNPTSIRRTSVALGLRTESSGRFEKNPDIELTAVAIDRAAQLLTELAGGTAAPGRVDFYPEPVQPRHIAFDLTQVEWLMGMPVTRTQSIDALRALGFGVAERADGDNVVDVTVPTWRGDVEESADLVEEVARIVGYEHVPALLPEGPIPDLLQDNWFNREQRVREILVGAGLTEIITYSLTNRQAMAKLLLGNVAGQEALLAAPTAAEPNKAALMKIGSVSGDRAVARQQVEALAERLPAITLRNPLSGEIDTLRLTLMSGLLSTLRENAKHEDEGLWLFEIGRRYLPTKELADGKGLATERPTLGVAITGPLSQSWETGVRDADFYDLKGVMETLLCGLKVSGWRVQPAQHPTFHPGRCARLEARALPASESDAPLGEQGTALVPAGDWLPVGVMGEVHPEVTQRFDLSGRVYLMELDLERLFLAVPERVRSLPIPRYPPVRRDLAVVVGEATPEADVLGVIRTAGGELLREATLFDVYVGEGVPAGKKSLAYALSYQAPDRTLTDAEVERAHAAIVAALGKRLGAALRG